MSKITPCLWFGSEAEEAANFYVSLVPNSKVESIQRSPADYPHGKAGNVIVVQFTLAGQSFMARLGDVAAQHRLHLLLPAVGDGRLTGAGLCADARRARAAALGAMGIRCSFGGRLPGAVADLGRLDGDVDADLSAADDFPELDMSEMQER